MVVPFFTVTFNFVLFEGFTVFKLIHLYVPDIVVTVDEPDHGRSTSDTVRFRDASNVANLPAATINASGGYTITKVNDNKYTFNSGVTASVTLKGGGDIASAGPVTVVA